ncbi:MAG: pseudouridine synthase [Caldisericia bacterium]|nr:pseudouridine synthase [Caldisericia bacterium]
MSTSMKLHAYVMNCNIGSRRNCEEYIRNGYIFVNGHIICKPETLIDSQNDVVTYKENVIKPDTTSYYFLFYKPLKTVTTTSDPEKRRTVMDFFPKHLPLFPVGRLDYNSEGLVIMTNDGELANKISHPRLHIPKTYIVRVKGTPELKVIERLRKGIFMDGYRSKPAYIRMLSKNRQSSIYEVVLEEGKNHQIRNMFLYMSHPVLTLKRVAIGTLKIDSLKPGEYRTISKKEIHQLFQRSLSVKQRIQKKREIREKNQKISSHP